MEVTTLDNPFSFRIKTSSGEIWINKQGAPLFSILLQETEEEDVISWQGEYDRASIAIKLINIQGKYSLATIVVEGMRISFFSTEGMVFSEELIKQMGNIDILFFERQGESISDSQAKKILEEIDPRVIIVPIQTTESFMKKNGFPLESLEKISLSKSSLPEEKTLFYAV
jgi:hypothetical protein